MVAHSHWENLVRNLVRILDGANRNQQGQTLLIFALSATFLIGMSGLAIEGGLLQSDRRFEQAISDGAALAGGHQLPDQALARQAAAQYAVAALNAGGPSLPAGCDPSPLYSGVNQNLPTACDPSPTHSLTIAANYNGNPDQILVRLDRTNPLNLARVVGFGTAHTASRSVAKNFAGKGPFGFAVYALGNMIDSGGANTAVTGNVYTRGCLMYTNGTELDVAPTSSSQTGTVQAYDKDLIGKQSWTSGTGGGGNTCAAKVFAANTGAQQWGAAGHVGGAGGDFSPGDLAVGAGAGFNISPPYGAPPGVPLIGVPVFSVTDTTGGTNKTCLDVTPTTFNTTGNPPTASPGCYSACVANKSVQVPNGTVFLPGTYAFVGSGVNGCDVIFQGDVSNSQSQVLGDGSGGVTFVLYAGTTLCTGSNVCSSTNGNVVLNAPQSGKNAGLLIWSCNGTCPSGSGDVNFEGPRATVNLTGTIYNPGGLCKVHSNAAAVIVGQLICFDVDLQGGSVSNGTGVIYGGAADKNPNFLAELIE